MARLIGYTAVRDEDGIVHSFGPGDDLPEWAEEKITNPKLFADGDAPEPDSGGGEPDTGSGGGTPEGSGAGGENVPEPPPKGGRGSGLEEWLTYALYFPDVVLPENASRDDVIDALDDAGVRTE